MPANVELPFAHLLDASTLQDYVALRSEQAWYRDTTKGLIELRGKDVREWLQGQVTNDIRNLTAGSPVKTCVCTPTGQLLADITIYDFEGRILLVVDRQNLLAVLHRIDMMVVMEDVEGQDHSSIYELVVSSMAQPIKVEGVLALIDGDSYHYWVRKSSSWTPEGREVGEQAIEIVRLENYAPLYGKDMNERTLPPEMGREFEQSRISYQKGCYTGQEVLMRIHSRGHTNKTWVRMTSEAQIEEGTTLYGQNGEQVGTVSSSVVSPKYGFLCAGTVKNDWAKTGTQLHAGAQTVQVIDG